MVGNSFVSSKKRLVSVQRRRLNTRAQQVQHWVCLYLPQWSLLRVPCHSAPWHCAHLTSMPSREEVPPMVKLDGAYKFVDDLYKLIPSGAPSLIDCKKLVVESPNVVIERNVVFVGTVTIKNDTGKQKKVKKGTYIDQEIVLE